MSETIFEKFKEFLIPKGLEKEHYTFVPDEILNNHKNEKGKIDIPSLQTALGTSFTTPTLAQVQYTVNDSGETGNIAFLIDYDKVKGLL